MNRALALAMNHAGLFYPLRARGYEWWLNVGRWLTPPRRMK
jgi:hypothetical protein